MKVRVSWLSFIDTGTKNTDLTILSFPNTSPVFLKSHQDQYQLRLSNPLMSGSACSAYIQTLKLNFYFLQTNHRYRKETYFVEEWSSFLKEQGRYL